MIGKIFSIAGSDPSGGAGIQADIKTITALGGYAMAAITALTVQNSHEVYAVHPVAADIVAAQVRAVMEDIPPDAIKVGMMGSADIVHCLSLIFSQYCDIPLIVDPVILSTSGHSLLEKDAVDILISEIFPQITLLTPNLAEAARLAGCDMPASIDDMKRVGKTLRAMGPAAVLVKGGHLDAGRVTDILVTEAGVTAFSSPMIETRHTHGTGCTLASAIATGIGQGKSLMDAVKMAHEYVHNAILTAPGFGHGKGPLNHLAPLD